MLTLTLLDNDGGAVASFPLKREPVYVGRAPTNDLVLDSRSVSGRHAAIWVASNAVWVEDLASRNGTFRSNGTRLRGVNRVPPGEVFRLGSEVRLRIDGEPEDTDLTMPMVCTADGLASFPLLGTRFVFGPKPGADLVVEGSESVTLTVHPTGELWLGRATEEGPLAWGEVFEVGGKPFVVRGSSKRLSATWDIEKDRYDYTLVAQIDGNQGATATLTDRSSGRVHTVRAENRVMFLFILARQLLVDRDGGLPATHRGWLADADTASGIWGVRSAEKKNLNVLVTRVRNELKSAGLDPWFVEKRKGYSRILLDHVSLGHTRHS